VTTCKRDGKERYVCSPVDIIWAQHRRPRIASVWGVPGSFGVRRMHCPPSASLLPYTHQGTYNATSPTPQISRRQVTIGRT
jgi:hypothetical protein